MTSQIPLSQRCVEPGRWIIEGRYVRAYWQGRSRNVLGWDVESLPGDGEQPTGLFHTLNEARAWIREQMWKPGDPVPEPPNDPGYWEAGDY
jgi:hypothetical protein